MPKPFFFPLLLHAGVAAAPDAGVGGRGHLGQPEGGHARARFLGQVQAEAVSRRGLQRVRQPLPRSQEAGPIRLDHHRPFRGGVSPRRQRVSCASRCRGGGKCAEQDDRTSRRRTDLVPKYWQPKHLNPLCSRPSASGHGRKLPAFPGHAKGHARTVTTGLHRLHSAVSPELHGSGPNGGLAGRRAARHAHQERLAPHERIARRRHPIESASSRRPPGRASASRTRHAARSHMARRCRPVRQAMEATGARSRLMRHVPVARILDHRA